MLSEAHETIVRMVEQAEPAFANLNGLLIPRFREERALAAERFNENLDLGVAKRTGEVRAKFREQPPRSILPDRNQRASRRFKKHIPQKVALTIPVEPAVKKPGRRFVLAARVPEAVKSIGWVFNRPDRGDQGGRRIRRGPAQSFRIDKARKLEQIVAFGARQG